MSTQTTTRPQLVLLVSPTGRKTRRSLEAADIRMLESLGWVVLPLAGLSR